MKQPSNILVLDIGTTGVKGFVFDHALRVLAKSYLRIHTSSKQRGWAEQNPQELLSTSRKVLRAAIKKSGVSQRSFIGLGITNQRETTVLWDRTTGKSVYPAIVWEDARMANQCKKMKRHERSIQEKTGLVLDPYFSATKIQWILEHVARAKKKAEGRQLLFGTVDSWIMWNILKGEPHLTDHTNASRTLLFNIRSLAWDKELINLFHIPRSILPGVHPSSSLWGTVKKDFLGFSIPLLAVCGDQQAGLFAAGTSKGTTKVTYGTGAFVSQIIGSKFSIQAPFFTTLSAYIDHPIYALEAKIDDCGRAVDQALRDPVAMKKVVTKLSRKVAGYINKLPIRPKEIIADGGVTQYAELTAIQTAYAHIPVCRQKIYDGTALGAALLVAQSYRNVKK